MGYAIINPEADVKIGTLTIKGWGRNRDANIIEMNEWDLSKGATLRYANYQPKYRMIEFGILNNNHKYHTGLLKLKKGAKYLYHYMDENEEWSEDTIRVDYLEYYETKSVLSYQMVAPFTTEFAEI